MPSPGDRRMGVAALLETLPRDLTEIFPRPIFIVDGMYCVRSTSAEECLEAAEGCLDLAGRGGFEDLLARLQADGNEDRDRVRD